SIADALAGGGGNPILEEFLAALQQDLYSFIPTMSALAIDNPDWFAVPNLNDSPFVNTYIPAENEPHVTVTAESAEWALEEIRLPIAGIGDNALAANIRLVENPVENTIGLAIAPTAQYSKLTANIYTMAGQLVLENTFTQPQGELRIPHTLARGMYVMQVETSEGSVPFKLVVQ
ncbi:MAG: hypothetical protein CMC14_08470, partial [Flavobacteriaceae bacterium]|nr:hypothetical protein [Flavobacteriaceae bacterium]